MKIETEKWYETRSGLLAFVKNVEDFDPEYPVLAIIEGVGYASFTREGRFWAGLIHRLDLVCQRCPEYLEKEKARLEEVLFD